MRRPGVSMMQAPALDWCSERAVVVWRPRLSSARWAPTSATSAPTKALVSVLLPAPLEPINTKVCPSCSQGASSLRGSLPKASTATAGTPGGSTAWASRSRSAGSVQRSFFVSTTTAWMPAIATSAT